MSIGPLEKKEKVEISAIVRTTYEAKRAVGIFFASPAWYLFWVMFIATIVGLYFGRAFSWEYYSLISFLFCVSIGQKIISKPPEKENAGQ